MPVSILIPADLEHGGVSARRARILLADELGFLLETTVSATSVDSGESARVVLSDDFREDEEGSTLIPSGSAYLYVVDGAQAGRQSRILNQEGAGYQGARQGVMLARPFPAALAAGTRVVVTGPLPVKRYLTVKGLDDCVNEALYRLPVVVKLTLSGEGSDRISLADAPYLTHVEQILGVYDRYGTVATQAGRPTGLPYRIDADGTTRYLALGRAYTSGESVELSVVTPGDQLIYDGISWGSPAETERGLRGEHDRAAVPEHWVLAFGMVAALRFLQRHTLRQRDLGKEDRGAVLGEIAERLAQWSITANRLRLTELPRGVPPRSASLLGTSMTTTDSTITDPVGSTWP